MSSYCMLHADEKGEDEEEQNLFMVKFEHHLLESVPLQGIRNVRKVFMRKEEATVVDPNDALQGYEKRKEWLLDSEGINLSEVLQVRMAPFIDCNAFCSLACVVSACIATGVHNSCCVLQHPLRSSCSISDGTVSVTAVKCARRPRTWTLGGRSATTWSRCLRCLASRPRG